MRGPFRKALMSPDAGSIWIGLKAKHKLLLSSTEPMHIISQRLRLYLNSV